MESLMESKCRTGAQMVLMLKLAFCSSDREHLLCICYCFGFSMFLLVQAKSI